MTDQPSDDDSPRPRNFALPFPVTHGSPGKRFTVSVVWENKPPAPLTREALAKARRVLAKFAEFDDIEIVVEPASTTDTGSGSSPRSAGHSDGTVAGPGAKFALHMFGISAPRRGQTAPESVQTGEPASVWTVHDVLVDGRSQHHLEIVPSTVSDEHLIFNVSLDAGIQFDIVLEYNGTEPEVFALVCSFGDYVPAKN